VLVAACVLGVGSSVFHPESSRVARMAAGDRPGLAQSLFQVGGNAGSALGPLGAAVVVMRWGRRGLGGSASIALVSTAVLTGVALWVRRHGLARLDGAAVRASTDGRSRLPAPVVVRSIVILMALIFSKFVYLASLTSYYIFYLVQRFGVGVRSAQVFLFAFLACVALGTLAGGVLGDRFGRRPVIWASILGVLPFTLALPYASLAWTGILAGAIGFVLASAFPAIVVYGQELIPGRVGMVSGLFFGLSFGAAGSGAALLGRLADAAGVEAVYRVASFLPALGLLAAFLPQLGGRITARPRRSS
jgi:FSR family fosmidomycin resistance protein-like MFS transporter